MQSQISVRRGVKVLRISRGCFRVENTEREQQETLGDSNSRTGLREVPTATWKQECRKG